MNRVVRWALLTVGLAGVVTAIFVATGLATPPSGLTTALLARGTDQSRGTIPLEFGKDIVMAQITVNPGGSSGWHSHPGVRHRRGAGDAHRYRAEGGNVRSPRTAQGRHSSSARAKWTTSSTTAATPMSSTSHSRVCLRAASTRIDQPDPGTCPGI